MSCFSADYSINGRAKCQVCRKVIIKNELRIGKTKQFKRKEIVHFHHVSCAFKMFRSARCLSSVIKTDSEIKGFNDLNTSDQQQICGEIIKIQPVIDSLNLRASKKDLIDSTVPVAQNNVNRRSIKQSRPVLHCSQSINIMFTNADQLTSTKMVELQNRISNEKPSIIAVTEVKTKRGKDREECQFEIDGFKLFHCNLNLKRGRGIAVYVANSLVKSVVQLHLENSFDEYCLLKIMLRGSDIMLFGYTTVQHFRQYQSRTTSASTSCCVTYATINTPTYVFWEISTSKK